MAELVAGYTRQDFETMRKDAKAKFDQDRKDNWIEWLLWTTPHRAKALLGLKNKDKVGGYPILDATHIIAHRSFVAGFLEGNTKRKLSLMIDSRGIISKKQTEHSRIPKTPVFRGLLI